MRQVEFRRADILKALVAEMKDVSANIYVSDRPDAVQERMQDFAVVYIDTVYDRGDTYQESWCGVSVFARDRANAVERADRLDEMQRAVCAKFPITTELFSAVSPTLIAAGGDKLGFHWLTVQARLIIKK